MCYNCNCAGYHEMNMDWLIQELKNALAEWNVVEHDWEETKQYITDYFANLDVQEEVNIKLDEMAQDGTIAEIINDEIFSKLNTEIRSIRDIKKRKIIVVSDSFGLYPNQNSNFITYLKDFYELENIENLSVSGTGFISNNKNGFLSQIENFIGNREEITDIIVAGGLNDSTFLIPSDIRTTLLTEIKNFCDYAKENYKNALITLFYIGNALDDSDVVRERKVDQRITACSVYREGAMQNGINFCDASTSLSSSDLNFGDDRLHPSVYGAQNIANAIGNYLLGGENQVAAIRPKYPVDRNGNYYVLDSVILELGELIITFDSPITGGTDVFLVKSTGLYANKKQTIQGSITVTNFNSKVFQQIPCTYIWDGYNIYCNIKYIKDDGTGWGTLTPDRNAALYPRDVVFNVDKHFIN